MGRRRLVDSTPGYGYKCIRAEEDWIVAVYEISWLVWGPRVARVCRKGMNRRACRV